MHLVDSHCHADEYSLEKIKEITHKYDMVIVGVSVDYNSSLKILNYSKKISRLIPCVGIHPWYLKKVSESDITKVFDLVSNVKCIGEIGLDSRFASETINKQRELFLKFLEIARDNKLTLNLHSVDTWREVLELLVRYDIEKAVFHWYTGPIDLLNDINDAGYKISINVALKFQKKHLKVLENAPIEMIVTESDGPYLYRGQNLTPEMIPELVDIISRVKEIDKKEVIRIVYRNFEELFTL